MPPKPESVKRIITRSQSKAKTQVAQTQTDTEFCVCPDLTHKVPIMDAAQKTELTNLFKDFATALRGDLEKESHAQHTKLDLMQANFNKKSTAHGLKPDNFDGNPVTDALAWLDNFRRIAKLNNWSEELQLNAFPLYLRGIAHAWFITLSDDTKGTLTALFDAFRARFASGPQDWILSQQLSARKHAQGEPIDDYITDITHLCKRLKLSDAETVRYFIEGLQGDLQAYVSLGRPKTFQEAESLARMKDIVNRRQGATDTQSVLKQMETMFTKFMEQPRSTSALIAAAAPAQNMSNTDKKLDDLSTQIKQIQKQQQRQQQQLQASYAVAAYDQPPGTSRSSQPRPWQGGQNTQVDQLQRQVTRLENELRRYQNPRQPDFRSFGRSYRSTEGDPICTYCNRVGHTWRSCRQRTRDPRLPPPNNQPPPPRQPIDRSPNSQLNG